ncbi:7565_t:CDS:2 [Ambispora leptoticha]|uniref:7565_t:CDS:1 n=1 Tax=Ambispora leptoticha TaxID=144679 RepID=A0A9N8W541_9GLOM|nr:7565_t:CDS:2 [Ambispora leptoticha]
MKILQTTSISTLIIEIEYAKNTADNAVNAPYYSPDGLSKTLHLSISVISSSPRKKRRQHRHVYSLPPELKIRYKVLQELGSGGFGFVVSAIRLSDNRKVAIKFIYKNKIRRWNYDEELSMDVPMEIFVLRRVDPHENIVQFVEMMEDTNFFYLVMEYHGAQWSSNNNNTSCDLFECMEQYSGFPESQARYIFRQIVAALCHLDALGIYHRDIKLENVTINEHFMVKLVDFGTAVMIPKGESITFAGLVGTYFPPEMIQGREWNPCHSQVWSLGILLYRLLFCIPPFANKNDICMHPYRMPPREYSYELSDLLDKLLEKVPENRPSVWDVLNHPWVNKTSAYTRFGSWDFSTIEYIVLSLCAAWSPLGGRNFGANVVR